MFLVINGEFFKAQLGKAMLVLTSFVIRCEFDIATVDIATFVIAMFVRATFVIIDLVIIIDFVMIKLVTSIQFARSKSRSCV